MGTRVDDELLDWLLEGDPAIRWRVLQGLTDASDKEVTRERSRVAMEGWGARLLAAQNPDGGWGEGVYSPKWTSTTYTLLRLLWLGLPPGHPAALRGCERLWEWRARWRVPETCVVGILVRLISTHGYEADGLDGLVEYLIDQQLADGGWNCATRPTRRSTARSTPASRRWRRLTRTPVRAGASYERVDAARPRLLPCAQAVPVPPHRGSSDSR